VELRNGVVVAPQAQAVEEGAKTLMRGGNAFDAAVATALVQTVVDPLMCGIAGFGVANCYVADSGEHKMINFYDRAPAAATPDMYEPEETDEVLGDYFPVKNMANQLGHTAVGTPGTLAGLFEVHRRYGHLSWRDVVAPAMNMAREGFQVHADVATQMRSPATAGNVDYLTKLTANEECARVYTKNGELYAEGEVLVNEDYANSLAKIAEGGPDVMYRGEFTARIDEDFRRHGGYLTAADLDAYRVRITDPVQSDYRGYRLATSPPPGGGVIIGKVLNILEGFDLASLPQTGADHVHLVASALRIAFADRAEYWGDPEFLDIPVDLLLSKEHAAERRATITWDAAPTLAGAATGSGGNDTTHLSVIDRAGNMVGITHTLGISSGVVVPGLGFMFNNAMHKFDPRPGRPNSIAPGKSRSSALSPTVLFKEDKPFLVLGSPGAFGIITGVMQTILNVVDRGDSAVEAVSRPRLHCEGPTVQLEARFPTWIDAQLEAMGHKVKRSTKSYDRFSGLVHAARIDYERGRVDGGADPRRGGLALTDE
jgi:gamma-glutamyltranspeptidase/glutathione hydrolase